MMKPYAFLLVLFAPLLLVAACGGATDPKETLARYCEVDDLACFSDLMTSAAPFCEEEDPPCFKRIRELRTAFQENPSEFCDVSDPQCRELVQDVTQ